MNVQKVDTTVGNLVDMIERGELRLPEMQRRYVWTATRVRDLLDSLYRGYPSGTILVWETEQQQPSRDLQVAQSTSPFSGHKLLLDGQQVRAGDQEVHTIAQVHGVRGGIGTRASALVVCRRRAAQLSGVGHARAVEVEDIIIVIVYLRPQLRK